MMKAIKGGMKVHLPWKGILCILLMAVAGCDRPSDRPFTIGVVNDVPILASTLAGFKNGMSESGYVEDKDIRYVYHGILNNDKDVIDAEIKELLSRDIDMLLTLGNRASIRTKAAVKGMDIPVVIGACVRPIEAGLIENLSHPGGNITGVVVSDSGAKALEWMKEIIPGARKIYLPYNPADEASVVSLIGLDKAASSIGIELVCQEVRSVEETLAAIEKLPKEMDAVFLIPSTTLNARSIELSRAAIKRDIPVVSRVRVDDSVLLTFAADLYEVGRQAARLANQIDKGVRPADLPVEISDVYLTVNLNTAEMLGIQIPDRVLAHAKTIIR
jgi:putative tryptophan/tyrosine transport system substrate-binding protein